MKKLGIQSKTKKRFIPKTTLNNPNSKKSPRVFKRYISTVTQPNQVWVGDITYIPTNEGFLYLAILLDLFSRKVIGWRLDDHMEELLVRGALEDALKCRALEAS